MSDGVYYNEVDPFACRWLRNLIAAGHLPGGYVDERKIQEVQPADLVGYRQHHFFAGIGGWPLALQLAGWPHERPCWTGSVPCQPFSSAGKGQGEEDDRNLWPEFHRLIRECRPPVCFGEQVDGAVGFEWLDGICAPMEAEGYAVGAAVLPAACVGAPHARHRLFWVAQSNVQGRGCGNQPGTAAGAEGRGAGGRCDGAVAGGSGSTVRGGHPEPVAEPGSQRVRACRPGEGEPEADGLQGEDGQRERLRPDAGDCVAPGGVEHAQGQRERPGGGGEGWDGSGPLGVAGAGQGCDPLDGGAAGHWDHCLVIPCLDGKARRVPAEPGLSPLAHGHASELEHLLTRLAELGYGPKTARRMIREAGRNRTGRLKGAGNAIVPQVAAVFIRAFLLAEADLGRATEL